MSRAAFVLTLALAGLCLPAGLAAAAAPPAGVSFSVAQKRTRLVADRGTSTITGTGILRTGGSYKPSRVRPGPVFGGALVHTDSQGGARITLQVLGGFGYTSGRWPAYG